jgi:hypothetical protein
VASVALFTLAAADTGARVEYMGGTLGQVAARTSGRIHTANQEMLLFEESGAAVEVAYEKINLLEYGQQAGRRYLLALAVSPILLLSKTRKHFLTVAYKDTEGRQQTMVFQVHKDDVRALLASLEARTGLKVSYLDGEARVTGGG